MSDGANNTTKAALGETSALPSAADMANNVAEERREIGRRARRLAALCLRGRPFNHDALFGLGPQGRAYFFHLVKQGMAKQLATAKALQAEDTPPPTSAQSTERPLLDIAKGWSARQVERRSYSTRAVRLGAIWAATLTLSTIVALIFFADRLTASAIQQLFERI